MRLNNILFAQHLSWVFKKHWQVQSKRIPGNTGASYEIEKLGKYITKPQDLIEKNNNRIQNVGAASHLISEEKLNPNWHQNPCYVYTDRTVLLEGMPQTQVLINTIEMNSFPPELENLINKQQLPNSINRNVQSAIMAAHVFDSDQVKLPKVRISERPAYNLPRQYGISSERKNRLLLNKLLYECEKLAGHHVASHRRFIDNATFKAILPRENDLIQYNITADKFLTSSKPISAFKGKLEGILPDLYPIKCTITLPKANTYVNNSFYPTNTNTKCSHPHTIFTYFNKEMRNPHGTPINESQYQSRTLLKAFSVAAAKAKETNVNPTDLTLSKPIVVQSIQTDGRNFHFGVFQLNTLDLNPKNGVRNYWFHLPSVEMFSNCGYKSGKPFLEGFNIEVFKYLYAFYCS